MTGSGTEAIRPFEVNFPEADLVDMRERINATRWPEEEPVADDSQGVPLATMQRLAHYWATDYDWRKVEARLAALPNFITEIDGLDIHFIHVRSEHENALPVIITHGWPGSIIEQLKIIDPLVNPTAHGGTAADAFHVVIPSMPGYGFSGKPTTTGWDQARIARAWAALMQRLGYPLYVAQGGDWGAIINDVMATQGHPELIGLHTNLPNAIPPEINKAAAAGGPPPSGLTAEEQRAYETVVDLYKTIPTQFFMGSHPQTLYGIADSPVGTAAWLLDHDPASLRLIERAFDGESTGLTRDDVLDNATLFWLTNTAVSAARLYREGFAKTDLGPKNITIPVALSVFPDEVYYTPRTWAERAYPNLVYYNQLDRGGHFAAWEQPTLLVDEMRAGLKSLR
ncbi:MAG TPA: epoxide hydrolase [Micromonosporaceae bacterium]|nr:epoxide hydrolase [Micromonosporaceae bacterium]